LHENGGGLRAACISDHYPKNTTMSSQAWFKQPFGFEEAFHHWDPLAMSLAIHQTPHGLDLQWLEEDLVGSLFWKHWGTERFSLGCWECTLSSTANRVYLGHWECTLLMAKRFSLGCWECTLNGREENLLALENVYSGL
jgi:hypothetical protein